MPGGHPLNFPHEHAAHRQAALFLDGVPASRNCPNRQEEYK